MMAFKFILKNLIIVFAIAWAVSFLIEKNMHRIISAATPQTLQMEQLADERLMEEREMLE